MFQFCWDPDCNTGRNGQAYRSHRMYIPNHILPPECGVVSNNSNNNGTGSSSSNDNGNFDTLNTNTNTAYTTTIPNTHSTTIPNASLSNLLEMSNEIQINEIMDNITATKRSSTTTTTTTK